MKIILNGSPKNYNVIALLDISVPLQVIRVKINGFNNYF